MPRAVHWLELVVGFFDFHRPEHAVLVKAGVAAGLPQIAAHDVRRIDQIVAAFEKFLAQPVLDDFSNEATFRMPENQAWTGFLLDAEEIQLNTELAMVAALGFFEAMQVFVQLFLCEK